MKRNRESKARIKIIQLLQLNKREQQRLDKLLKYGKSYVNLQKDIPLLSRFVVDEEVQFCITISSSIFTSDHNNSVWENFMNEYYKSLYYADTPEDVNSTLRCTLLGYDLDTGLGIYCGDKVYTSDEIFRSGIGFGYLL